MPSFVQNLIFFFNRTNVFHWFEADLQIVSIWMVKFKPLCRFIPKIFTETCMEMILVPLGNQVSILSDLFLVNVIDLNLSELRLVFYRKKMLCSIRYRF